MAGRKTPRIDIPTRVANTQAVRGHYHGLGGGKLAAIIVELLHLQSVNDWIGKRLGSVGRVITDLGEPEAGAVVRVRRPAGGRGAQRQDV